MYNNINNRRCGHPFTHENFNVYIYDEFYNVGQLVEPSHDFQVFLRRLKDRENQEIEKPGVADADEFTSKDGNTKGYVIFRRSLDHFDLQKELSQSSFGGAFLTFGLVG